MSWCQNLDVALKISYHCFYCIEHIKPKMQQFILDYCEITFICGVPIFVVFVGRLIHEIKNPTNNETWEASIYWQMRSSSDLDFLDQLHRVQLTILMTK